jgi:Phospholipid methyltransferase
VTVDSVQQAIVKWLKSTPNRTFAFYPAIVIAVSWLIRGGLIIDPFGVPLLAWGYLQYRLVGNYRTGIGGGGPGFQKPPERIVAQGPYRFTRNPMYLGHLIFMVGLAITFHSWLAVIILAINAWWFHQRVLEDERALEARFGADYLAFKARVKRWIPGVL